ncbi:uroporphyrinogen-III synthase [Altererythrobacter xiamenensis]|uniref:Uroporphyrinogen-III synthase n=1 Tax=Altererythrobacter xiamenensis TaxID=1316679 RepID=A0A1Y6FFF9_9SPHN|nr:uroporphyrinogen-III synthase [Altererythrobacter xiamenensis]SMQ73477.1 uroporphyrinogen-III synthase [Altererythrobacter xiamenensis]
MTSATGKIIAIRPEPGLSNTVAAGRELGLDIAPHPLSRVEPLAWDVPPGDAFDGLLIGSANAVRHAGEGLAALKALPVFAVGKTTADAAQAAGFTVEKTGEGGLQSLLDGLESKSLKLLRLAGEDRIVLTPPEGVTIASRTVYRVVHLPISSQLASQLSGNPLVLLHSAKSAEHFASECNRLGIDRAGIALAAIGPRVLAAAGPGWRDARSADDPNDPSLLALARYMWH